MFCSTDAVPAGNVPAIDDDIQFVEASSDEAVENQDGVSYFVPIWQLISPSLSQWSIGLGMAQWMTNCNNKKRVRETHLVTYRQPRMVC